MMSKYALSSVLVVAASAGALTLGCSSSSSSSASTACTTCVHPPAPPSNGVAGDGTGTTVLAIDTMNLGVGDDWKSLGYDLDNMATTLKDKSRHCIPVAGATPAAILTDGNNGIDNSFGANILNFLGSTITDEIPNLQAALAAGNFTIMVGVDKLGMQNNYVGLNSGLYAGGQLVALDAGPDSTPLSPKYDGNDYWPVMCELMTNCQASGTLQLPQNTTTVVFPASYVNSGTWVSSQGSDVGLNLAVDGYTLAFTVHKAILTMALNTSTPRSATNGILAGILNAGEVTNAISQIAGKLSSSFCDPSTLQSLLDTITQASDIMTNGPQDPTKTCDGISLGIGFTTKQVQFGAVYDKAPASANPCTADGGADGGST